MTTDEKRLFFGFETHSPWPETLPDSRTLKANDRHLTVLFLGNVSYKKIRSLILKMPKPSFRVGPVGIFDACLCLPKRHPHVVTWHIDPFGEDPIADYHDTLISFFRAEGYEVDEREFLKHVTLGRAPFALKKWKKSFYPLPLYFHHFHLYESLQGLHYEPIWTHDIYPPFKEVKKDLFLLYGESFQQIFLNAQIALAFKCPELLPFLDPQYKVRNLHDGGIRIRSILQRADREVGIPIKDAKFPDSGTQEKGVLNWELEVLWREQF